MLIGKAKPVTSGLCRYDAHSITVRERNLAQDLMGQMSFTEFFFFLTTGQQATPKQVLFLDTLLISLTEHGMTPTAQTARMTYAADPNALQAAVAAGILGCGSVVLGTAERCGETLIAAARKVASGNDVNTAALATAKEVKSQGKTMPGFGHPIHKPVDPRSERLLELAESEGIEGAHIALVRAFPAAVEQVWGKPLTMNVSMMIAAVLLDLDFPPGMLKSIPILSRTSGLLAHLAEEQRDSIGFMLAHYAEAAVEYRPQSDGGES